jgi:hypothetical protein
MNTRLLKNAVNATTVVANVDLANSEYLSLKPWEDLSLSYRFQTLIWLRLCRDGSRKVGVSQGNAFMT